jgi:hypothetical protein
MSVDILYLYQYSFFSPLIKGVQMKDSRNTHLSYWVIGRMVLYNSSSLAFKTASLNRKWAYSLALCKK